MRYFCLFMFVLNENHKTFFVGSGHLLVFSKLVPDIYSAISLLTDNIILLLFSFCFSHAYTLPPHNVCLLCFVTAVNPNRFQ